MTYENIPVKIGMKDNNQCANLMGTPREEVISSPGHLYQMD